LRLIRRDWDGIQRQIPWVELAKPFGIIVEAIGGWGKEIWYGPGGSLTEQTREQIGKSGDRNPKTAETHAKLG